MSEQILPQNPDRIAEQNDLKTAAEGNWEAFAQPGFEKSAGEIAVNASAELAATDTPAQHEAVKQSGYTQSASGLLLPAEGTKANVTGNNDVVTTDTRRWTPESVEADFQKEQEALREPLSTAEVLSAYDRLGAAVLDANKEHVAAGHYPKGDLLALFRLRDITEGGTFPFGHDQGNKAKGMNIGDRLKDLVESTKNSRAVDAETRQIVYAGYNGGQYYQAERAKQIWETMTADPKIVREQVLKLDSAVPDQLIEAFTAPMVVPEQELIPANQLLHEGDKVTLHSTPTAQFGSWVNNLHNQAKAA